MRGQLFGLAQAVLQALSAFKQFLTDVFREGFLMNRKQTVGYTILLFLLAFLASSNSLYGQGKLGRVRDAVRNEKPAKSRDKKSDRKDRDRQQNRSKNRNRGNSSDSGLGIFLNLIIPTTREVHVVHHSDPEPIYQPVVAPLSHQTTPDSNYFSQSGSTFDWGVRLTAVGGTDFDGIAMGSFGLLLQIPGGLGIDTSVTMLRESGSDFRDHLHLGDVNLVYEPISTELFRMRIGAGVNWLGDAYGGDAGFNMTCGFDWKLTDRLLATGEFDFGSIGDTDLTRALLSLGRALSASTEWTVGYDFIDIGGVTIGSGFTGLRFRF